LFSRKIDFSAFDAALQQIDHGLGLPESIHIHEGDVDSSAGGNIHD
jgi:hypothetical protein